MPADRKDWHPGSNDQVLNLVHPSLYPLVYGRTRVLPQGARVGLSDMFASWSQGEVATETSYDSTKGFGWSKRFQWLPCEIEFSTNTEDGSSVRIASYINNLHPAKHQGLYRTIEKIISLSIPLWNDVVMYEYGVRTPRRIVTYGAEWGPEIPEWAEHHNLPKKTSDHHFAEFMQKVEEYLAIPNHPDYSSDSDDDIQDEDLEDALDNEQAPSTIVASLKAKLERIENNPNAMSWEFVSHLSNVLDRKWRRLRHVAHPEPGQSFTYEGRHASSY